MSKLDFLVPAELFVKSKSAGRARNSIRYRRFDNLYSAVHFAMDEYGADLNSISIQTDTDEYLGLSIRSLYENEEYPLKGRPAVKQRATSSTSSTTPSTIRKFKIGDTVRYSRSGLTGQGGHYEVVKVLPIENAEPAYRIKSKSEQHERAVKEHEIALA